MPIATADDKFYYTDKGGKIAKGGLSESKRSKYDSEIAAALAPQASAAPMAPEQAPMMSTVPATTAAPIWEQPAAFSASTPDQLNLAPSAPMASQGPVMGMATEQSMPANPLSDIGQQTVKSFEQGIAMQQAGARKQANAVAKMNQEAEKEQIALRRQQDIIDFDIMQETERRDAAVTEAGAKLDTLRTNYAEAKIDPDRFFGGSTGKRLLAGLAIAFGEIGRSMTGGQSNAALNIINKAIDDDIASQKESIANKQNQIILARQGLADIKDLYKDKIDAQLAQKVMATEMAQSKIKSIAAQYGTQEALAKADVLIGQLEVSKAEAMSKMFEKAAKGAQSAPLSDQQIKAVSDLSSAYEGNEGIKSFNKIDQAFRKMENLAKLTQSNPNAAQAIITTFNRVLDENSVVREAEVNLTMQAGSVVDRFKQQAEKFATGKMTPEQTANLVEAAKELRNAALTGKQNLDRRFTERANAFGVPANLVISPLANTDKDMSQLTSFTPRGQEPAVRTQTANRVMPGR